MYENRNEFLSKNLILVSVVISLTLILTSCSNNLSEKIRNQKNCALLSGDKVKIIDGLIVRDSDGALMGEIFKNSNSEVKVFDDKNESKIFSVKEHSKDGKFLIALQWDKDNILLACGVN